MRLHELKRKNPNTKKVRVGRGGKRGKTSGRGHKGQKARAGRKIRPEIRDMIKKIPKKRGYKFNSYKIQPVVVNVSSLDILFNDGEKVNIGSLVARKVLNRNRNKGLMVKILGKGDIKNKLSIEGLLVSEKAKEKVLKAGGSVK